MTTEDANIKLPILFLGLVATIIALIIVICFALFYFNARCNAWIKGLVYKRKNQTRLRNNDDDFLKVQPSTRPSASPIMQCSQPDDKEVYCTTNEPIYAKINKMATLALEKSLSQESYSESTDQYQPDVENPPKDLVYAQIDFENANPVDSQFVEPADRHIDSEVTRSANRTEFEISENDYEPDMPTKIRLEANPLDESTKVGTQEYNAYHSNNNNNNEIYTKHADLNVSSETVYTIPKTVEEGIENNRYLDLEDASVTSVTPNSFV